ncbi:dienelactone hydrolase [Coniochaeta sp. 2T2.1]|nr:dienelactone hydrolase [Coniochaeta sp. 2T2.1]
MTAPVYSPVQLSRALCIQGPLTRRGGTGPGLLIIQESAAEETTSATSRSTLDPEPLQKWAEEGFCVARIDIAGGYSIDEAGLQQAIIALEQHERCAWRIYSNSIVAYSAPAIPGLLDAMERIGMGLFAHLKGVVSYGAAMLAQPHLCHLAERGVKSTTDNEALYYYPEAQSTSFVLPSHPDYLPASAAVAHSRSLEFLKKQLGGPWFDLEAIWEEHTRLEFAERAVEETMNTMVEEPYVNHVPTMTGGIGRKNLTSFYAKHFIFSNPDDTELQLISRTVGIDRVVDEFIFALTHDRVIDWLIPGIPPTGKKLRIPFTAVVNIRGDRLCHEHIAWDQLTVLFQLSLMPEYLPFPYPVEGYSGPGKTLEYRVPGAGHEVADKLVDESSVESNGMFSFVVREARD